MNNKTSKYANTILDFFSLAREIGIYKAALPILSKFNLYKKIYKLQIELTTSCNLKCIMCEHSFWSEKAYSMKLENFKKIIDYLPNLIQVDITGIGETLLYNYFIEAIEYLHETIHNMCKSIAKKLSKKSLHFRTVTVKIRYSNYSTIQRSKSIPVETDDEKVLHKIAIELFDQKRDMDQKIRLVGVKVSGLIEKHAQLCLTEFI